MSRCELIRTDSIGFGADSCSCELFRAHPCWFQLNQTKCCFLLLRVFQLDLRRFDGASSLEFELIRLASSRCELIRADSSLCEPTRSDSSTQGAGSIRFEDSGQFSSDSCRFGLNQMVSNLFELIRAASCRFELSQRIGSKRSSRFDPSRFEPIETYSNRFDNIQTGSNRFGHSSVMSC